MSGNFQGHSRCDLIMNNFCNIIVYNSPKLAWNCSKFCDDIGPNYIMPSIGVPNLNEIDTCFKLLLIWCEKEEEAIRREEKDKENWIIFRSTHLGNYISI